MRDTASEAQGALAAGPVPPLLVTVSPAELAICSPWPRTQMPDLVRMSLGNSNPGQMHPGVGGDPRNHAVRGPWGLGCGLQVCELAARSVPKQSPPPAHPPFLVAEVVQAASGLAASDASLTLSQVTWKNWLRDPGSK